MTDNELKKQIAQSEQDNILLLGDYITNLILVTLVSHILLLNLFLGGKKGLDGVVTV